MSLGPERSRTRLGVLGGSFDPIHLGHIIAAQDAFEQMELDRVVFMPAARAPLKERVPSVDDAARLMMVEAAIAGDPRFELSSWEISRGGVSFTIDTARWMRQERPGTDLFWIIGADQADRLHEWREISELGRILDFIVLARPGFGRKVQNAPASLRLHFVDAHVIEISSSELRERIAAGRPVRAFLPASVADLIERNGFYR